MEDQVTSVSIIEELPSDLILCILKSDCLSVSDFACLETTCTTFGGIREQLHPTLKFRSLVDLAVFRLCESHPIYSCLNESRKKTLLLRMGNNWKQALNFLRSVEESSDSVQSKSGSGYIQVTAGISFTIVLKDYSVYISGVRYLGDHLLKDHLKYHKFTLISFDQQPLTSSYVDNIVSVSTMYNHAAFITQSGKVFTCGNNSSGCCGHTTGGYSLKPRLVEGALKGIPCKQVAIGNKFTVFLTREGRVYTCGRNSHGQLGHGDMVDRPTPMIVESLVDCLVVQVSVGLAFTLALTSDGNLYSFGSGEDWCLGHRVEKNELRPRLVKFFKRRNIHILRVSAGAVHVVALDSSGLVYTWGRGEVSQLCNIEYIDDFKSRETTPYLVNSLKSQIAIQVIN
ncbi:probable E3 ubiquitin-protein ligase HERC4 [Impatiens glandulifera]|uniref:probable E3 ubiquitin-protein ligase HERC4 n=1 Tax=Impatiens glandulifera TaxID=253017 RepID=UPI001FB091C5|nr:probable E3 ubiquitin-protein ligase HERC4 [Impatiens glandulifera]